MSVCPERPRSRKFYLACSHPLLIDLTYFFLHPRIILERFSRVDDVLHRLFPSRTCVLYLPLGFRPLMTSRSLLNLLHPISLT